jgi:hypothetical protein
MQNNNLESEFVPYELALEMKALGFNERTNTWRQHGDGISGDVEGRMDYYNKKGDAYTALPTYYQAFRWFREEYNIPSHIATHWQHDLDAYSYQYHFIEDKIEYNCVEHFETYEEAELACLQKLIESIKEK